MPIFILNSVSDFNIHAHMHALPTFGQQVDRPEEFEYCFRRLCVPILFEKRLSSVIMSAKRQQLMRPYLLGFVKNDRMEIAKNSSVKCSPCQ
jgi:hypothetical protein